MVKVSVEEAGRSRRQWQAYRLAWTETPCLFFVSWLVRPWVALRQTLLRNAFTSARLPFPCWRAAHRAMTLGEVVLWLACVMPCAAYCVAALLGPADVEASGTAATAPLVVVFGLATRNSLFTWLLGIPFERQLFWHRLGALLALAVGWAHGVVAIWEEGWSEDETISGVLFCGAMSAMLLFSLPFVRRYLFNVFYFLHVLLALSLLPLAVAHEAGAAVLGLAWWGVDVLIRFLILALLRNPHECTAVRLPANVIRLTTSKFSYNAGQYVFIMIPRLNVFEWHPFSLSSSPHHDKASIHIRVLGNWTRSLYELIHSHGGSLDLTIYIDGPYGAPEIDVDSAKYKLFLLISGGIGVTPMQSLCNHLMHEHEFDGRPLKKVWFVWSVADKYMVSATLDHDAGWSSGTAGSEAARLPTSFQPDNLQRVRASGRLFARIFKSGEAAAVQTVNVASDAPDDVLETQFYLTRVRDEDGYADANIRPELQQYVRFGRPPLDDIFAQMREQADAAAERRVAVLVCGPSGLVDRVRALAGSASSGDVAFDFHSEVFAF